MATALNSGEIALRLRTMLRRDLKLGATAELPEEMPLIGGNMDLDSLDVLLLVTNIEKEFGVKVASGDIGREAFESVGSLIRFVAARCAGGGSGAAAEAAKAGPEEALSKLPHQHPFRFVSQVTEIKPGIAGEGVWAVSGKEAFLAGHFPGNPMVPGVLIAEALAQMSGVVGAAGNGSAKGKLAQVDVRFLESVTPPAEIVLETRVLRTLGALQQFEVLARCGEMVVAQGTVTIAFGEEQP